MLTSTFPRWAGDTEPRFVLDLCRELSAYAEIAVLAPHAPNALTHERIEGVEVRRFRYFFARGESAAYEGGIMARIRSKPWRILLLPLFCTALFFAVRRLIRTWSPDLIHAHWIIPQGVVACAAAGRSVPVLCTSHGGDLLGLRAWPFRRLKSWTLARCRQVTVVSSSMVARVRSLAPKVPIEVIPMGVDLRDTFVPPEDDLEREPDRLVFVGRLVEKKGLTHLLEALASLQGRHGSLRLTVAGDGPLRGQLEQRAAELGIADRVDFVGSVHHSNLPRLYQRASLAVFPFVVARDGDQEGFGLVVVEAMGCKCPVIAGDVPAVRESIEPEITGILTPSGNAAALATAIAAAMDDAPRRTLLASTALIRARERFDWRAAGRRYAAAIDEIVEAGRKAVGA